MSKIYQKFKNFLFKPVLYTGLAASLLTGCDKADILKQNQPKEVKQEMERNYFENWGFIDKVRSWTTGNPLDIELGDFDGDGDLDIAVATNHGGLRLYENRISQKKE